MPDDTLDNDELDGCELDFAEAAEDEETSSLRRLFPDGEPDQELAETYRALAQAEEV